MQPAKLHNQKIILAFKIFLEGRRRWILLNTNSFIG